MSSSTARHAFWALRLSVLSRSRARPFDARTRNARTRMQGRKAALFRRRVVCPPRHPPAPHRLLDSQRGISEPQRIQRQTGISSQSCESCFDVGRIDAPHLGQGGDASGAGCCLCGGIILQAVVPVRRRQSREQRWDAQPPERPRVTVTCDSRGALTEWSVIGSPAQPRVQSKSSPQKDFRLR